MTTRLANLRSDVDVLPWTTVDEVPDSEMFRAIRARLDLSKDHEIIEVRNPYERRDGEPLTVGYVVVEIDAHERCKVIWQRERAGGAFYRSGSTLDALIDGINHLMKGAKAYATGPRLV